MQESAPKPRPPGTPQLWKALFDLAIAASNRNPEAIAHNLRAVAGLAETSGKTAEARRLRGMASHQVVNLSSGPARDYLVPVVPRKKLDGMVLPASIRAAVSDFLRERAAADKIRACGFPVVSRIVLLGPTGCGKTSLAQALAAELQLPMFRLATHAVVGSLMGETASRLVKVLEQVEQQPCLLLLDEADALFWRRTDGGSGEGEMRRTVAALLPVLEGLSDSVVLVAATNASMSQMDAAVLRRFNLCLHLPEAVTEAAVLHFVRETEKIAGVPWGEVPEQFVQTCLRTCQSLAEVEAVVLHAAKGTLVHDINPQAALQWAAERTVRKIPETKTAATPSAA